MSNWKLRVSQLGPGKDMWSWKLHRLPSQLTSKAQIRCEPLTPAFERQRSARSQNSGPHSKILPQNTNQPKPR